MKYINGSVENNPGIVHKCVRYAMAMLRAGQESQLHGDVGEGWRHRFRFLGYFLPALIIDLWQTYEVCVLVTNLKFYI